MRIRQASEADDAILVRHYLALWESYGTPPEHLRPDAEARILAFIVAGRDHHRLASFLAQEAGQTVGSASCQVHTPPFPEVITAEHRLFGYIWSVYVESEWRRRGIARKLVQGAIGHLRETGCTHVALHSSEAGQPLYEQLGFNLGREMRLPLLV
jgi:ribosomal protein S18 acetylase RimI-like enzyme